MNILLLIVAILVALAPVASFMNVKTNAMRQKLSIQMATAVETKASIGIKQSPDFYWQFRLDRLTSKKNIDLFFSAKNYPEASSPKELYDAYYLDLTLQGKLSGFDWKAEKEISDSEWLSIYKSISKWSVETAKENKPDTNNLPSNDFDLLKQFYPQLEFRDLETPFIADEVGASFPYSNMKDLLSAAANGKLNIPGSKPSTTIDASEAKAALAELKTKSMAKVDAIYQDTLKFAQTAFPDEQSRAHYKALQKKLGDFPQGAQGWAKFRANMDKEVDEMARLAAKKEDPHHGHEEHGDEHHAPSPAQEFQAKYGLSLDELQETMSRFKANPEGFLEASIVEKHGRNGLDVWKKSQEFAALYAKSSAAEIAAAESAFTEFLKSA